MSSSDDTAVCNIVKHQNVEQEAGDNTNKDVFQENDGKETSFQPCGSSESPGSDTLDQIGQCESSADNQNDVIGQTPASPICGSEHSGKYSN